MDHEAFMRRAIELSREKMSEGYGGPFGCVVVMDGEIVGEGWNQVTSRNDPTSHAEIVAIRQACLNLGTFSLEGAVVYASCEPCPMCLGAIYWSRASKLYFANATEDAARIGFDDGVLYSELCLDWPQRALAADRLLADEAVEVFSEWMQKPDRVQY